MTSHVLTFEIFQFMFFFLVFLQAAAQLAQLRGAAETRDVNNNKDWPNQYSIWNG